MKTLPFRVTLFSIGSLNTAMGKSVSNNLVSVLNFQIFTNREASEGECKIEKNIVLGSLTDPVAGENPATQIIPWQ